MARSEATAKAKAKAKLLYRPSYITNPRMSPTARHFAPRPRSSVLLIGRFKTEPKVVHGDILITKLRQNQCIDLTCHARKSNGKDHAKYSPVATASYRMKPCVQLNERVFDEDADRLAVLEPGVFRIVKVKGVRGR